ncbi:hypothetical protein JXM83_04675 [Candidatus Woesearchaeota archaeon]|nr:hypothetical protein [Candidatus Woesearchaeota archaeon]
MKTGIIFGILLLVLINSVSATDFTENNILWLDFYSATDISDAIHDYSNSNNNFMYTGVTLESQNLYFDGSNDYLYNDTSSSFRDLTTFTIFFNNLTIYNRGSGQYLFSHGRAVSSPYIGYHVIAYGGDNTKLEFFTGTSSSYNDFVSNANFFVYNEAHDYAVVFDSGSLKLYRDGSLFQSVTSIPTIQYSTSYTQNTIGSLETRTLAFLNSRLSGVFMWNDAKNIDFIQELHEQVDAFNAYDMEFDITSVFCSSSGDNESPYTTSDTTPTFVINTTRVGSCRIASDNITYAEMGDIRNCSTESGFSHICTLPVSDELLSYDNFVYISCYNGTNILNLSLEMNITGLVENRTRYLDIGIEESSAWPEAKVYNNQQVYLRNSNNDQVMARIDRVIVLGNQRWLINYDNTTTLGLFNITPVVYVLEMGVPELSLSEIKNRVKTLIDSTKN